MTAPARDPWHPDRRWADPLIALLALLVLLASGWSLRARKAAAARPAARVSLQGQLAEVALAGPRLLIGRTPDWERVGRPLMEPWDRALLAILRAELDPQAPPVATWVGTTTPAGPGGEAFEKACLAAYGEGPAPSPAERAEVQERLGGGYGAALLEARLGDGSGGLRRRAERTLLLRLVGLGLLGLMVLGLGGGGLATGAYLLATRRQEPPPLPAWSLSGRAAVLIFLAWFLAFFLAGNLAALLLWPFPGVRWLALPLGYALHAAFGLGLLCWAEGLGPQALWRRLTPGPARRDLAWSGAFLALAVTLVFTVALAVQPLLPPGSHPQRDLQEFLRSLSGLGPTLVLFLTVAGVAPLFEEVMFRGFLLPILAQRTSLLAGLALSALLFGAIHLQPTGLPVLATLGLALGLAMRQTASLRTPVLVHACWNGTLFLLMRALA